MNQTFNFLFYLIESYDAIPEFCIRAFSSNFGKRPLAKLGEINDIEHNKDSKIYPQNQVILDCIMPTIPL